MAHDYGANEKSTNCNVLLTTATFSDFCVSLFLALQFSSSLFSLRPLSAKPTAVQNLSRSWLLVSLPDVSIGIIVPKENLRFVSSPLSIVCMISCLSLLLLVCSVLLPFSTVQRNLCCSGSTYVATFTAASKKTQNYFSDDCGMFTMSRGSCNKRSTKPEMVSAVLKNNKKKNSTSSKSPASRTFTQNIHQLRK